MTSHKSPIPLKNLQSLILLMSKRKVSPVEVQIDHTFKKKKGPFDQRVSTYPQTHPCSIYPNQFCITELFALAGKY